MNNKILKLVEIMKSGAKIKIKDSQKGSFTKYCNGKVTNECIRRGKNSPDPKIRKKAIFAQNARKWKHASGGSTLFEGIKTTNNRSYNPNYINYINDRLASANISPVQRISILANIIEESGGDPFTRSADGKFYGLLQWDKNRYKKTSEKDVYKEIDNQVNYILSTINNTTDSQSWTHGGKGSNYNTLKEAISDFNTDSLENAMRGFTLGYVRPSGKLDTLANRYKVAQQLQSRLINDFDTWYQNVPKEYNDTTNYNLKKAYETLPKEQLTKWIADPENNHLPTGVELSNGDYEYLKSMGHPSILEEIVWENGTPEGRKWRADYSLSGNWTNPILKRNPINYVEYETIAP